ncbi:putative uncharacterized protein [Clostridium sp. CAG:1193]|nr:putative uncharacterized protein [Clostridium sp. CAG:1193]
MKNKKVIIILISILLIVVLCLLLFYLKDGLEPKLYNKDDKKVRMIKLNDKLYYDTGIELYNTPTCGTPDVIITKRVNEKEEPLLNGESNFGTDIYIQYNGKDILNVNIDSKWIIFSSKEIKREKLEIPHKIDVDINKNMDIKKYSINIDNIKFKNVVDEYLYDYKDEYRLLIDEIKTKYNDFDEKRYKLNINIYSDNNDGIIKLNYMIGEILTNKSIVFNVLGGKVISVLYINMDEYVNEYDLKERIDKFNLSYFQEKKLMRKDEEFIKDKVTFKYYYNIDKIVYEYQMFFYETKDNLKTINNSYVSEYIVS